MNRGEQFSKKQINEKHNLKETLVPLRGTDFLKRQLSSRIQSKFCSILIFLQVYDTKNFKKKGANWVNIRQSIYNSVKLHVMH